MPEESEQTIVGYCIAFGMICLGLLKPSSKKVTVILLLYMWVLIAFNSGAPDYYAYEEMFLCCFAPRYALHEPGYMFLCKLCLTIGLSYEQFRMFIAAIIVILLWKSLDYFTPNINYVLSLLLVFPFIGNVSGLRNAVASWIIVYGSRYLFSHKKGALWKYAVAVFAATLFHYSSVFFLIMLLVRLKKVSASSICFFELLMTPLLLLMSGTGLMLSIGKLFLNSDKVLFWLEPRQPRVSLAFIAAMGLFVAFSFLLVQSRFRMRSTGNLRIAKVITDSDYQILYKVNAFSLLAFLGAVFSTYASFFRILQTVLPISYCFIADSFFVEKTHYHWKLDELFLLLICVFSGLFVYGFWITKGDAMFGVFVHNHLIDRFI